MPADVQHPVCVFHASIPSDKTVPVTLRCMNNGVHALDMSQMPPVPLHAHTLYGLDGVFSIHAKHGDAIVVLPPGTIPYEGELEACVFECTHGFIVRAGKTIRVKSSMNTHDIISSLIPVEKDDRSLRDASLYIDVHCTNDRQMHDALVQFFPDNHHAKRLGVRALLKNRQHHKDTIVAHFAGKKGLQLHARACCAKTPAELEITLETFPEQEAQSVPDDEESDDVPLNPGMLPTGEEYDDDTGLYDTDTSYQMGAIESAPDTSREDEDPDPVSYEDE
jgi:hypothetical protein